MTHFQVQRVDFDRYFRDGSKMEEVKKKNKSYERLRHKRERCRDFNPSSFHSNETTLKFTEKMHPQDIQE
jgi:hypothetical protein